MASKCKQIFILSGQSNMTGRGGVTTDNHHHKHWNAVVPPECHPHPSILRLNAHLHWEEARDPLHSDLDSKKVCGVGPGMSFANAVRERVEETLFGLVPCAVGGTAIREWARGTHLYESMVKRARFAVEDGGVIEAVLWFQGESDTSTAEDAAAYLGRLEKMICDLREDLKLPLLPFIQGPQARGGWKGCRGVVTLCHSQCLNLGPPTWKTLLVPLGQRPLGSTCIWRREVHRRNTSSAVRNEASECGLCRCKRVKAQQRQSSLKYRVPSSVRPHVSRCILLPFSTFSIVEASTVF